MLTCFAKCSEKMGGMVCDITYLNTSRIRLIKKHHALKVCSTLYNYTRVRVEVVI